MSHDNVVSRVLEGSFKKREGRTGKEEGRCRKVGGRRLRSGEEKRCRPIVSQSGPFRRRFR